jgi:hypothetical protein
MFLVQSIVSGGTAMSPINQMQALGINPAAHPEVLKTLTEADIARNRDASEGQWRSAEQANQKAIATAHDAMERDVHTGHDKTQLEVEERHRQAEEDTRDQTYKQLEMGAQLAQQLYLAGRGSKQELDAANGKLLAYSAWKASQRGNHQGAGPGSNGLPAPPPAPGISAAAPTGNGGGMPPELLKSLTQAPQSSVPQAPENPIASADLQTEIDRMLALDQTLAGALKPDRAQQLKAELATRGITPQMLQDYRSGLTYGRHTGTDVLKQFGAAFLSPLQYPLGAGRFNKQEEARNNSRKNLIDNILQTPWEDRRY